MTDGIDPATWPSPRGPWPEVVDLTRRYDHGRQWCVHASGHPGEDGYPDVRRHFPWDECRSAPRWLEGACSDLAGPACDVTLYLAAAFRFGQPRRSLEAAPNRVVVDWWPRSGDQPAQRISLGLGEATRLSRILLHLVDQAGLLGPA